MPNFKSYNYDQNTMVVINYQDQLQPGTFEYAIHHLIEKRLDLSIFFPCYNNDDTGRPAYDPAILLKIVLFAYSKGITSSREIQWCCHTNIIFKALSCDTVPHFTTIASFVSQHVQEIELLFEQVLLICHEQGLLGNELFAIDGCKMPSNAAKEWSGTFKELEEKSQKLRRQIHYHLQAHQQLDQQEDKDSPRIARTEQAIDTLNKAAEKVDRFLKTHCPRMGQAKQPKEVKSNITDNESAKMTTSKGTIQGYNGLATVDKKHQIIVDAQAFGQGQEQHTLAPILEQIETRFKRLNIADDIYATGVLVTADTGFASEANMAYLHEKQINAYVPDNRFRSRDPKFAEQKSKYGKRHSHNKSSPQRQQTLKASEFEFDPTTLICRCPAGEQLSYRGTRAADHRKGAGRHVSFIVQHKRKPTYTDWMKHRVDSEQGKQIYSHRMSVVEPVFGNIASNKKLNRFSFRGKKKVQSQWQLFCMIHNIEKLANYGDLAA